MDESDTYDYDKAARAISDDIIREVMFEGGPPRPAQASLMDNIKSRRAMLASNRARTGLVSAAGPSWMSGWEVAMHTSENPDLREAPAHLSAPTTSLNSLSSASTQHVLSALLAQPAVAPAVVGAPSRVSAAAAIAAFDQQPGPSSPAPPKRKAASGPTAMPRRDQKASRPPGRPARQRTAQEAQELAEQQKARRRESAKKSRRKKNSLMVGLKEENDRLREEVEWLKDRERALNQLLTTSASPAVDPLCLREQVDQLAAGFTSKRHSAAASAAAAGSESLPDYAPSSTPTGAGDEDDNDDDYKNPKLAFLLSPTASHRGALAAGQLEQPFVAPAAFFAPQPLEGPPPAAQLFEHPAQLAGNWPAGVSLQDDNPAHQMWRLFNEGDDV